MVTRTWVGGSGAWENAFNWVPLGVPGPSDDAVLGAGASAEISSAVETGSVTLDDPGATLTVDAGASLLASAGVALAAGTLDLIGPLTNSTLSPQGGVLASGSTLENVTIAGTLDQSAPGSVLQIAQAVTLAAGVGQPGLCLTGPGASLAAPVNLGGGQAGAGTLNGGIVFAGSADPSRPVLLDFRHGFTLGSNLTLDVVGSAEAFGGSGTHVAGDTDFAVSGLFDVAPGGTLVMGGFFTGQDAIHVASGTLDLRQANILVDPASTLVRMDDGAAKLLLGIGSGQRVSVAGFRAGDTIDIPGVSASGPLSPDSSGTLTVGGTYLLLRSQTAPGATYTAAPDGSGGTLVTTTAEPAATAAFMDQTAGAVGSHALDTASGGPSYLQWQYIDSGSNTVAMATSVPDVFLKGGAGNKAIAVTSGENVLDGGTGSAFLTGGSGTDTFVVDLRGTTSIWDTLVNFHAGDAVTIWGWSPGSGTEFWDALDGAQGYQGATLRLANAQGGLVSSVTFAGLSADQAAHLQMSTGTAGGLPYLYLANPGV